MSDSWLDDFGVGTPAESLAELAGTLASPSFKGLVLVEGWSGRLVVRGGAVSLLCGEQCRGAAHDVQAVLLVAAARRRVRLLEAVGSRSPVAGLARHAVRSSRVPLTGRNVAVLAALASGRQPLPPGQLPRHPMPLEATRGTDATPPDGIGHTDWTLLRDLLTGGSPWLASVEQWVALARLLGLGLVRVTGTDACPLLPGPPAPSRRPRQHEPAAGPALGPRPPGPASLPGRPRVVPVPPELPRRVPGARRLSPQARALLQGIASREISVPGMRVTGPQSPAPPVLPRRRNGQRVTESRPDGRGSHGPGTDGPVGSGDEDSAAS